VILVDSSVWIDFLRDAPTPSARFVADHAGDDLATSEPILMEVLAGARPVHVDRIEHLLHSQRWCHVDAHVDFRGAAEVFRATRARGHQPRSTLDCLIAAVALRRGVALAHRDRDFEHIAAATGLGVVDLR